MLQGLCFFEESVNREGGCICECGGTKNQRWVVKNARMKNCGGDCLCFEPTNQMAFKDSMYLKPISFYPHFISFQGGEKGKNHPRLTQ